MARDPAAPCTASARLGNAARAEEGPAEATLPHLPMLRRLSVWIARARQRSSLAGLSDHTLKDFGLSRSDALREAGKPFWRP